MNIPNARCIIGATLAIWVTTLIGDSQTSYFNQGFLRQPSAEADRNYLGITNSSGGGSGSVSNFTAANFSPLFTSAVSTPTSTPHLSFIAISQSQNLMYASPNGAAGIPVFRALVLNDLPDISAIVRGDVSAAAPILYDSVTGIFSMHVADSTHDGYLSASDWNLFNGNTGNVKDLNGSATNTALYVPAVIDVLNFGDTNGSAGSLTFSAGPANAWEDFTLSAGVAPVVHFHVMGDLYFTGGAHGSGAFLTDIPISGLSTNGGQNAQIATIGTDGAVHWSNAPPTSAGTLTGVTNASFGLVGASIISTSNGPVPSFKSISAGPNTTVTDNGTNLVISSTGGGGGGSSGIDVAQTNLVAFANATNFFLDFNWQAQKVVAPGDIAFNYSTNWPGSSSTSRVATLFIPATNYLRHVSFITAATNWHVNTPLLYSIPAFRGAKMLCQIFGQGDTNVTLTPLIDDRNDPTLTNILDLSSLSAIPSATNVLWVDAERGVYQDAFMTAPAQDGMNVLGWADNGGQSNNLTNNTSTFNSIYFHNAATAPLNVPCLSILPSPSSIANTWLRSPSVSKLTQPVWVFLMVHGNRSSANGANVLDSLSGTTTRVLCTVGFKDLTTIASANTSSFQVTNNVFGKWELMAFKFNSTTSQIRTNSVSIITNNAGTGVGNGFTFASDIAGSLPTSETDVAEMAVFWGNLTAADLGNIETNYFRVKYGAW